MVLRVVVVVVVFWPAVPVSAAGVVLRVRRRRRLGGVICVAVARVRRARVLRAADASAAAVAQLCQDRSQDVQVHGPLLRRRTSGVGGSRERVATKLGTVHGNGVRTRHERYYVR